MIDFLRQNKIDFGVFATGMDSQMAKTREEGLAAIFEPNGHGALLLSRTLRDTIAKSKNLTDLDKKVLGFVN